MEPQIKNATKHFWLTLSILLVAFLCATGCAGLVHHSDPLAGWKFCYSDNPVHSNKTIVDDYQKYIGTLSQKEQESIVSIDFYEDMTGQHAVRLITLLGGSYVDHVLIYDNGNKRIKVIKYVGSYSPNI